MVRVVAFLIGAPEFTLEISHEAGDVASGRGVLRSQRLNTKLSGHVRPSAPARQRRPLAPVCPLQDRYVSRGRRSLPSPGQEGRQRH